MGRETCDDEGCFLMHIDFVTDEVDLVVNPHYKTVDSQVTRWALTDCGVEGPCYMINGDVNLSNVQWVTVAFRNPEDTVKIKLLMQEIPSKTVYTMKDLETC
jgi:hypothetical protein